MQTFLPYPDFKRSAEVLDSKRLGKQRVEAYQILNTLLGNSTGWVNHPAVKMWRGSIFMLILYTKEITNEWVKRGYKDTVDDKVGIIWREHIKFVSNVELVEICGGSPIWLGNEQFHNSHKSNLLRKNYEFYSAYNWNVPNDLPYYWPVK